MTLGERQRLFTRLLADLIVFAYSRGYGLTLGEAYRSDEQAEINAIGADGRAKLCACLRGGIAPFFTLADKIANNTGSGIRNSLHEVRLAVDFNLFDKDGKWLSATEDFTVLGEYWEGLNPQCRWGGRFKDGNHFSIEHEGRK